jgi:hypothetical protein
LTWRSAIVYAGFIGLWAAFVATGNWAWLAAALAVYVGGQVLVRRGSGKASSEISGQAAQLTENRSRE